MTSQLLRRLIETGASLFGLRSPVPGAAGDLVDVLRHPHTVLLTGATGFIGSRLAQALGAAGHDVIALARNPAKAAAVAPSARPISSLDQLRCGTRIDAIVNLAGEPIANGLWTRAKRRRILTSRLRITRELVRLIGRLETPPKVLISGSAVGWYGAWQDEALTEFDGGKNCFTHRVCEAWEQAARRAQRQGVRVVRLRIGLVLGPQGGRLRALLVPFRLGLGGRIGAGTQWMSWIERDDLVRLIAHAIASPQLLGPVNATAPEPVRNAAFTRALGGALNRPTPLRYPAAILRLLAGDFADELMLGGQRVLPAKAQASGFEFRHPILASALAGIVGRTAAMSSQPDGRAPATCLAAENPASTVAALASVASPALDSQDCIAGATRGAELARGPR
jgi:uncharacterized protein (TIGR01777 family)